MEIKYLGHASFQLKGKSGSLVTDPFDVALVGFKFPKDLTASIVTVSHEHKDHSEAGLVGGEPLVITLPGEYEKDKIRVTGFATFHDDKEGAERGRNVMYKIEMDDLSILHCGDLGHVPSEELVEEIGTVDILLVPVGGFYTIDAEVAAKVIHELEPSIVIPMHYKVDKLSPSLAEKLSPVADFIAKMEIPATEPIRKLVIKKEDLTEEMKVVVMDVA